MNIEEMKRALTKLVEDARAMLTKADTEKRQFTPEEDVAYRAKETEIKALKERIKREEELSAEEQRLGESRVDPTKPSPKEPVVTQPETRCMVFTRAGKYEEGRAIDPKKEFRTLGEQLQAVALAAINPHRKDPRLIEERAISGLSEAVDADGGFIVQKDFLTELAFRTYNTGEILTRVSSIPLGANSNGMVINVPNETSRASGSRWGGVTVSRSPEGGSLTGSKPAFRKMELKLKKLYGLCYATDELLQDASALDAVINDVFPKEMSFVMENEIIAGDGAGQMLGILNAGCLVSVAKETGQTAATVLKENIDKMWARMFAGSRANAVWLINQDIEPQLDNMSVVIGTGGVPVYLPPGGLSDTPYSRLKGRMVIPVEYCPTLGTVGDIILADFSQYKMINKGGIQAAQSMHVRFLNDEMTYRFIMRNDGQPTWNAALTPFKGSNTQSPFVVLATRA